MNKEKLTESNRLYKQMDSLQGVIDACNSVNLEKAHFTDFSKHIRVPESCLMVVRDVILAEYNRQLESVKKEFESL